MEIKEILNSWPFPYPPRPNQELALEWLANQDAKYLILEAPVGCHLAGTPILMYNGHIKKAEDIQIGDLLMGPDSKPRYVSHLHSGTEQMYTITPIKGDPFVVNENHILSLKLTSTKQPTYNDNVINISVKEYLTKSKNFKNLYKLYHTDQLAFNGVPHTKLSINPYLLGYYLGDGHSGNGKVEIVTNDVEIKQYIVAEAQNMNMTLREWKHSNSCSSYCFTTGKKGGTHTHNLFIDNLRQLDLYAIHGNDKFIPIEYKLASASDRLQLLAGLMDSDGSLQDGCFNFSVNSELLANDCCFVAKSLGLYARVSYRSNTNNYRVLIGGDTYKIPTKIKRKQHSTKKRKRVILTKFSVEPYGIDKFYGFEVDKDHLYVMGNFIVTHNSGKSNVGISYATMLQGNSFILTPQRVLQHQYSKSFEDNPKVNLSVLYGKSNYTCAQKNATCDIGELVRPRCDNCPFKFAKSMAQTSAHTVLNYKLALTSFAYTDIYKRRKLMILDECHTLENHLVDFDAVKIAEWRCKKYNLPFKSHDNIPAALTWLGEEYIPKLEVAFNKLDNECEYLREKPGKEITNADSRKLKECERLGDHVDEVSMMAARTPEYVNERFVIVHDPVMFEFKRLTGAYSFNKIVQPMADKFLFMSSTVLNKDGFCKDIGINPDDTAFLSLDSEFPVENRPVFYMPQMKMNAAWNKDENKKNREKMLNTIVELLEMHKDDSGILHTANFAIAVWLVKELSGRIDHKLFHHNPDSEQDRNEVIDAFQEYDESAILISPSITEGLDLKDDLGRFALIVKVPFGFLGDQWIKRRMEMSKEWYQRRALIDIIQGGGRVVRSAEDSGNVYILDGSFAYLKSQTNRMIPKWWKDSYQVL